MLLLADQLLHRLELNHSKEFLHQDIKPENFLMGLGRYGNTVYVTDLGMAEEYMDARACDLDVLDSQSWMSSLVGTARYASITGHLGRSMHDPQHPFIKK